MKEVLHQQSNTVNLELPGQLAFKTSSQKKRKLSRQLPRDQDPLDSPSPDSVLPSCEVDDDPALSFSATSAGDPFDTPSLLRTDSLPASSLPPRLQTQGGFLVSADYASSAASSPCASAYAELSLGSDKGADDTGPALSTVGSQVLLTVSQRAIMNGDADLPHRSSSPLKRRASSMDPENDADRSRDTETNTSQTMTSGKAPETSAPTLPRAMSIDPPESTALSNGSAQQPPPLLEQVKIIETLIKASAEAPLKDGAKAYLVSRSWVNKALAIGGDPKAAKKEIPEGPLGPVDNSDIIEETLEEPNGDKFIRLKAGSGLEEFELFSEDAWNMVIEWYGIKEGQQPIIRYAINTAPDLESEPNILYEFHPPIFRVHRVWSEQSPIPIEQSLKARNPPVLVLSRSRKYHAQSFIKELKTHTGISPDRKVRLFTIEQTSGAPSEPRPALTPPDSPGRPGEASNAVNAWSRLLIDLPTFGTVTEERKLVPVHDQTVNGNYNGKSTLQLYNLVTDQTLVVDENIDQNAWVSNYVTRARGNDRGIPTRSNGLTIASAPVSGRSSPGGPFTRGRTQKQSGRSLGAVGLQNLGNTCYMNSALQCVRSVEELTKYFLTGDYTAEINKTNRLGYNGKIAMTYGNLLKDIYTEGKTSVSPRDFKTTVGRCRSTFSGWGQQDSQEFLGFLLDGLQEDLSRVKEKPYIEKPDSTDDMINDPDAIRGMADKVWDITRKRDDSVIADLFTGMYKSTLKCPECGKVSITFDPFNNLTLPLPVEDMWQKSVKFLPLNDVPVTIEVELPKHSAIEQLFQYISIRTGVPANRLIGGEEFKDRFFKIYDPTQDLSEEIAHNDFPTIHELEVVPTNWPGKARTKKFRSMLDIETPLDATEWDDPRYEKMAVPVLHRRPNAFGRQDGTSPPHFIILTREEASNMDIIRRKVLEKVATFSTWSVLKESNDADGLDPEMIITSTSDADSSGDSKVVAQSIEGDDDIVDIKMKGIRDRSNSIIDTQPKLLKHFNTQRPKFVGPDGFLDPELQNLFDLSYFTENKDGNVPTGWQTVDQNKTLPKLTDRIPEPSAEEDEEVSPESWNSTASNEDESTNDESSKAESTQTRMMDESSEEDPDPHPASRLGARPAKMGPAGRKKFKGHKTYGKKGNKRRDKQARGGKQAQRATQVKPQPTPPGVADGGPLIRLGEGLVIDWNEDAWEKVFGGSAEEDQGAKTFVDLETLHDKALKIVQRRRHHRRTRGITLEECLDEFERAEILSEQDMWYCPRCKEHRRASKKFDLWKTPDILVCHLKRFTNSGWRREKLDVLVDFPIEGLDLTSRVIQKEDGKDEIYDLIAVDDHYGGLGGGHYTAYAKNFVDGRWYNYNDSSVSPVSDPAAAITDAAYLLFYRRRSSSPLGGSRFAQIFDKYEDSDAEEENESGEDQRLGGGSSLVGSSSAGTGAVAIHRQVDPGLGRTTVTELTDPDADEDDDLPTYGSLSQGNTVHYGIEDEGIGMGGGYQPLEPKSLSMAQGWNFNGLGSEAEDSTGANCASDEAQPDSSADGRGLSPNVFDDDVEMTGQEARDGPSEPLAADATTQLALSDIQKESWDRKGVISVPAAADSDNDSNDVAEIHLDGDKNTRSG